MAIGLSVPGSITTYRSATELNRITEENFHRAAVEAYRLSRLMPRPFKLPRKYPVLNG